MAVVYSLGSALDLSNGFRISGLPTISPAAFDYTDTSVTLEFGNTDSGHSYTHYGTFTVVPYDSEGIMPGLVLTSGTITSFEFMEWWHDYEVEPATYTSRGFGISGIKLTLAQYTQMERDGTLPYLVLSGSDQITGSALSDKLYGMAGNDTIVGAAGNDTLDGGTGVDLLQGGAGNDLYLINDSLDRVVEAPDEGIDTIIATTTFNLTNAPGVEVLQVTGTADLNLRGNALDNVLIGNSGANIFIGGAGSDTASFWLSGGSGLKVSLKTGRATGGGDDFLISIENVLAGSGADRVEGNGAANRIEGMTGNDTLLGGGQADTLFGGTGDDQLFGGNWNDSLAGDLGNDTLTGGDGRDRMSGGLGADIFDFNSVRDSGTTAGRRDVILDFRQGRDQIDLRDIDAISGGRDDTFSLISRVGSAKSAIGTGKIGWYQVDKAGTANDRTILRMNTDRDAEIEMSIELVGLHIIKSSMFLL